MKIPTKIDITSSVTLDEIKNRLITDLSTKQLVEFILSFGDDMTDGTEYWVQLYKKVKQIFNELEQG